MAEEMKRRRSLIEKAIARANREKAIAALVVSPTVSAAAISCGLGESTLRRWLTQPKFVAEYRAARKAALEQVIGGWLALGSAALDTLKRNLSCGNPNAEVRAAAEIRQGIFKGEETLRLVGELEELREQVAKLQEQAKEGG